MLQVNSETPRASARGILAYFSVNEHAYRCIIDNTISAIQTPQRFFISYHLVVSVPLRLIICSKYLVPSSFLNPTATRQGNPFSLYFTKHPVNGNAKNVHPSYFTNRFVDSIELS